MNKYIKFSENMSVLSQYIKRKQNMAIIKGHKSSTNVLKIMCNNFDLDLIKTNAYI